MVLGEPTYTNRTDRKALDRWFPEAILAVCWVKDGKTLCLALEQQDRETPVGVLLRCESNQDIESC